MSQCLLRYRQPITMQFQVSSFTCFQCCFCLYTSIDFCLFSRSAYFCVTQQSLSLISKQLGFKSLLICYKNTVESHIPRFSSLLIRCCYPAPFICVIRQKSSNRISLQETVVNLLLLLYLSSLLILISINK